MLTCCIQVQVDILYMLICCIQVQVDQLKVLKEAEKKFNFSPDTKLEKKASMKRRQSLLKLSSLVENMREQPQNRFFLIPNYRGI